MQGLFALGAFQMQLQPLIVDVGRQRCSVVMLGTQAVEARPSRGANEAHEHANAHVV